MKQLIRKLWNRRLTAYGTTTRFFLTLFRVIHLAFRGFNEDKIALRASALTYYSMLSVVPVFAMVVGIAKGFGLEKVLRDELTKNFSQQQQVLEWILKFADSFLANIQSGVIAGMGLLVLFWTVMKVLVNIELSFNDIWQVRRARSWGRRFSDYLSLMLIAPILFIASSSLTVFIEVQFSQMSKTFTILEYLGPVVTFFLQLTPMVLIAALFTILYMMMPNTKVILKHAAMAGLVAGILYTVLQWGYIAFQVKVSSYNTVYGSFAALPLFLVWLQLSWLIVLFGAEISFAFQNVENYEFEAEIEKASPFAMRLFSFAITHMVVKRFEQGEAACNAREISHSLELPVRLVRLQLDKLVQAGIVAETRMADNEEVCFLPAQDISRLNLGMLYEKLDCLGSDELLKIPSASIERMKVVHEAFLSTLRQSADGRLIKEV